MRVLDLEKRSLRYLYMLLLRLKGRLRLMSKVLHCYLCIQVMHFMQFITLLLDAYARSQHFQSAKAMENPIPLRHKSVGAGYVSWLAVS